MESKGRSGPSKGEQNKKTEKKKTYNKKPYKSSPDLNVTQNKSKVLFQLKASSKTSDKNVSPDSSCNDQNKSKDKNTDIKKKQPSSDPVRLKSNEHVALEKNQQHHGAHYQQHHGAHYQQHHGAHYQQHHGAHYQQHHGAHYQQQSQGSHFNNWKHRNVAIPHAQNRVPFNPPTFFGSRNRPPLLNVPQRPSNPWEIRGPPWEIPRHGTCPPHLNRFSGPRNPNNQHFFAQNQHNTFKNNPRFEGEIKNKNTNPIKVLQTFQDSQPRPMKFISRGKPVQCGQYRYTSNSRSSTNNTSVIKYKKKEHKQRVQKKKIIPAPNIIDSECKNINVTPLLSFHKDNTKQEKNFNLLEFSDEDDTATALQVETASESFNLIDLSIDDLPSMSQHSANTTLSSLNIIDSPLNNFADSNNSISQNVSDVSDSDYSDSDESEVNSEISVNSSIIDTEASFGIHKSHFDTKEAYVSVFWDIENCNMPAKKSVIDFVSYVRQTFYEGRIEEEFAAACDVSRLSSVVVKELDEASVTIMHISSINKNAADKKIESCLQRFQHRYHNSNAAVVLISSDSDFTRILHDMRYKHRIFINLICGSSTKRSLIAEVHKHAFFEDIMQKIPDRSSNDHVQHILLVTNVPKMKTKSIKNCLKQKLKSFNCHIAVLSNPLSAEIIFQDRSVCDKAMSFLEGFYLGGNALIISYEKRLDIENALSKKKKIKASPQPIEENILLVDVSESAAPNNSVVKESESGQPATLCVFVQVNVGNTEYWKMALNKILKNSDFTLLWDTNNFDGCLLINFKSLTKARKAMKIIQTNQVSDEKAPKFFKLLKVNDDVTLTIDTFDVTESNKKKILNQIEIVQKKTATFLRKHVNVMNKIKLQRTSKFSDVSEAAAAKLTECKEQIETFENYSALIVERMQHLNFNSENLDEKLNELLSDFVRECNSFSSELPIYAKKEVIMKKILENQVVVIRAETGSGKSTQLVQYILKERNLLKNGKIICTQPRKIAAISLARHVSMQVGSTFGDIVGYQVGLSRKSTPNTKILYVTDFTMLKVLVNDGLNGVACIIIDEAHERTIYTDILLGMIKKHLPSYPHLKVIITSATINTAIFQDYFCLSEDMVLNISGRTFPIEDVWLEFVGTDYVKKVIDVAFCILTEEPGDILCFLVTPLETEKAVEKFNDKLNATNNSSKITVHCLHGQLKPQEQQKVFDKTPEGSRKVIFATNCAETSITIPGIKYVIDSGLVKESRYDSTRNMNVLTTGFVSKSSAEQRRGRAGRTQAGKCYHLYSQNTFKQMRESTDPEILRINLSQALLKLMKMGISNPAQFDFVQSPPREQLQSSMDQLLRLKAVDDETWLLTELGSKMAVLPVDPCLGHIIFQGFDHNVAYEAIIIAASLTMSSSIFFRNSDNMIEADKKKSRFCEPENDFLMFLEIYKEWNTLPKNMKSQWCVTNCINARSMRIVHDLINEVMITLTNELGENFNVKARFCNTSSESLVKILFSTYFKNLAVYSGHYKLGYKTMDASDCLIIHPSSSLRAFGQAMPQYLVYESILKTSQTFMLNICPVSKEMILNSITSGQINVDIKALEDLVATELCMKPLGEKVIVNHFIGKKGSKRKELIRKLKELTNSDLVEIDISVAKGEVRIFGYGSEFKAIPSLIVPEIENAQDMLLNEEKDVCLLENKSTFIGILVAGGLLKDVVLPGEFRDIKVMINDQETIESVVQKLSDYGLIKEIREWKKYFKITYDLPSSAQRALELSTNQEGFSIQSIKKYVSGSDKSYLYKVFMRFLRRKCNGVAYVGLNQPVSAFLLPSFITYKCINCKVRLNKKSNDIQVTGLPPDTERKELERIVSELLPEGYELKKLVIVRDKAYEASVEEINSIKERIIALFAEFTVKEDISVELKVSSPNDFFWNAIVYFQNSHDGETAVRVLKSRDKILNFSGGIVLKPELQTYLFCKKKVFLAVQNEIKEAIEFFEKDISVDSKLDITVLPKGEDYVEIKIVSNNISDLTDARRSVNTILKGDELKFSDSQKVEIIFTESGKAFIKSMSVNFEDCYIVQNTFDKTITLYGKESICNLIKMQINGFLREFENYTIKGIDLRVDSGRSILKELLKNYGYDLSKLTKECNLSDIQIDKYKQILTVQGNSSALSKCEAIIQHLKKTAYFEDLDSMEEVCPVCYDELTDDKHRLEYCGHAYCKECLFHLFQSSDQFPLRCDYTTNDSVCNSPIVVSDIIWALNERRALKDPLFEKILRSFVETRDDICYCPFPDCAMIYRTTGTMDIYKCPACNNDICVRCQELYHSGMTCSLNKILKNKTVDVLKAWMEDNPSQRKMCPSCSSPIEKNGGCNHMICWKCKSHMCWLCLQVFSTGEEVYSHQSICPQQLLLNF